MDITDILSAIETNPNRRDRCISISELIIYLKHLKNSIHFIDTDIPWKQDINEQIVKDVHKSIDKQIEFAIAMLDANLEQP